MKEEIMMKTINRFLRRGFTAFIMGLIISSLAVATFSYPDIWAANDSIIGFSDNVVRVLEIQPNNNTSVLTPEIVRGWLSDNNAVVEIETQSVYEFIGRLDNNHLSQIYHLIYIGGNSAEDWIYANVGDGIDGYRLSGNDITNSKRNALQTYVNANNPVIIADELIIYEELPIDETYTAFIIDNGSNLTGTLNLRVEVRNSRGENVTDSGKFTFQWQLAEYRGEGQGDNGTAYNNYRNIFGATASTYINTNATFSGRYHAMVTYIGDGYSVVLPDRGPHDGIFYSGEIEWVSTTIFTFPNRGITAGDIMPGGIEISRIQTAGSQITINPTTGVLTVRTGLGGGGNDFGSATFWLYRRDENFPTSVPTLVAPNPLTGTGNRTCPAMRFWAPVTGRSPLSHPLLSSTANPWPLNYGAPIFTGTPLAMHHSGRIPRSNFTAGYIPTDFYTFGGDGQYYLMVYLWGEPNNGGQQGISAYLGIALDVGAVAESSTAVSNVESEISYLDGRGLPRVFNYGYDYLPIPNPARVDNSSNIYELLSAILIQDNVFSATEAEMTETDIIISPKSGINDLTFEPHSFDFLNVLHIGSPASVLQQQFDDETGNYWNAIDGVDYDIKLYPLETLSVINWDFYGLVLFSCADTFSEAILNEAIAQGVPVLFTGDAINAINRDITNLNRFSAYEPGSGRSAPLTVTGNANYYINSSETATKATQVNNGILSNYPYDLTDADIDLQATPHIPPFQLNMNTPGVSVWYCLGGDDYKHNDVSNAFYIYQFGNFTYSGINLSAEPSLSEAQLFVNTMLAAAREATPTYEITFDPNDGLIDDSPDLITETTGTDGKLEEWQFPTPTRGGHTFSGWFTEEENGVEVTFDTVFEEDTIVYAQWEPIVVTFNPNEGVVTPTSAEVEEDDNTLAELPTPTRGGYEFIGWFTLAIGGEAVTTSTVFNQNTVIYAQWAEIIVTFNPTGGEVTPLNMPVGADGRLEEDLPEPTRPGFTFTGWFTAASGGTEILSDRVYTESTMIFAQWSQIIVTFDPTGGTVAPPYTEVGLDGRLTLTSLPEPAREGYFFNGWFTEEEDGELVYLERIYTENTTLYAQWTRTTVEFTIPPILLSNTFDPDGEVLNGVDYPVDFEISNAPVQTTATFSYGIPEGSTTTFQPLPDLSMEDLLSGEHKLIIDNIQSLLSNNHMIVLRVTLDCGAFDEITVRKIGLFNLH
jgi:uncharacterized repeat protein (TIGR02543 family)